MSENEVVVVQGAPDLSEIDKQKLKRDTEEAKKKQKILMARRKKAPTDVKVGKVFSRPRDELVRRLVPEAIPEALQRGKSRRAGSFGDGVEMRAVFAPDSKRRKLIAEGWEPVTEDGHHVSDGADFMYKRPMVLTADKKKMYASINKKRIKTDVDDEFSKGLTSDGLFENVTDINKE